MALNVTALGGQEAADAQIPVTFIRMEIDGADIRHHDLDVDLYLHPTSLAASLYPFTGALLFTPGSGFTAPDFSMVDDDPTPEVSISLANQDDAWFPIVAAGDYRGAVVTVWRGNLSLTAGSPPWAATVVGTVKEWEGSITHIEASDSEVRITAEPPDFLRTIIPSRTYNYSDFPRMPRPGTKYRWGFTEVSV
jgi:hypothetical protein